MVPFDCNDKTSCTEGLVEETACGRATPRDATAAEGMPPLGFRACPTSALEMESTF